MFEIQVWFYENIHDDRKLCVFWMRFERDYHIVIEQDLIIYRISSVLFFSFLFVGSFPYFICVPFMCHAITCFHLLSLAFTCLHSFRLLSRAFLLSSSLKSHRFPFSFLLYQDPSNVRILYHKHRKLFIKSKSNRWLCRICYFDEFSFEICF